MIDLAGYSFPENRASIVCKHVWDGDPVLVFAHDSDGDIQFYCGAEDHSITDALVLGLEEIRNHVQSMEDLPRVRPGYCAERHKIGGTWTIMEMED